MAPAAKRRILARRLKIVAAAGCLLLAAGEVARRTVPEERLRRVARAAYRQIKTLGFERAAADNAPIPRADAPLMIYDEGLGGGWEDWSWADRRLADTTRAHRGKQSISMTPVGYKAVYLHHAPMQTGGYGSLQFYVFGSSAISVGIADAGGKFPKLVSLSNYLKPPKGDASGWKLAQIPLADLGLPQSGGTVTGFVFQAADDKAQPVVFFDEISLQPDLTLPLPAASGTVAVTVDPAADQHPISPYIYGMAFAPPDYLSDLRLGLNRWGGNHASRYNWTLGNACSAARDWRWANRVMAEGAQSGPSSAADTFISGNAAAGTETLLTIPTLGWVARNSDNETTSVNVPNEGGAPLPGGNGAIAGYDPTENRRRTCVPSVARKGAPFSDTPGADSTVYQDEWVHHLVKRFGPSGKGGVRFYAMDNEPDLWDSTHTDVHPARAGYDDVLDKFLEYATAVKAVDPAAKVTGPVSWGWVGYLYSSLDRGADNFGTHADRMRHGGDPFLLWFLKQVREHDARTGKRTLDVLDVHYYPQGEGLYTGEGGRLDPAAQALRLRATRSLWDPTYNDESWIADSIHLIPRLKNWIAAGYPGTEIGVSEWNFGGDSQINGALAIADTLGIYGREGVYFANYWDHPKKGSPGYLAFKLFRNPDGQGHGFGDQACLATSAAPDQLSCYAATEHGTGALTLLLVNKTPKTELAVPIAIRAAERVSRGSLWRLSASDPTKIAALEAPAPVDGRLTLRLPPQSITLARITVGSVH